MKKTKFTWGGSFHLFGPSLIQTCVQQLWMLLPLFNSIHLFLRPGDCLQQTFYKRPDEHAAIDPEFDAEVNYFNYNLCNHAIDGVYVMETWFQLEIDKYFYEFATFKLVHHDRTRRFARWWYLHLRKKWSENKNYIYWALEMSIA